MASPPNTASRLILDGKQGTIATPANEHGRSRQPAEGIMEEAFVTAFEKDFRAQRETVYTSLTPPSRRPFNARARDLFLEGGKLRPFRLLKQDIRNIRARYVSDWTLFNQLVFASAVYVFFTNLLPGITFASDLYVLTGGIWSTIEVVFSTGLCGIIFAL